MNPVTVDELQRAWRDVQAGHYRATAGRRTGAASRSRAAATWVPGADERVVTVAGAGGSVGATTLALALATVQDGTSRVVECSPAHASGLAAAAYAELGPDGSGWVRGTRDHVTLERRGVDHGPAAGPPHPREATVPLLTVVDIGSTVDAPDGWPVTLPRQPEGRLVLAARASVPGLRRLELELDAAADVPDVVVGVLGPARRRWPRELTASLGPRTRHLDHLDRLVVVPLDRDLAARGLTPDPLPDALLTAAVLILDRLEGAPR